MDDKDLRCLEIDGNLEEISVVLHRFFERNLQTFTLDELNKTGKKHALVNAIMKILDANDAKSLHLLCLDCIRIISRDKQGLNDIMDERKISTLLRLTALCPSEEAVAVMGEIPDPVAAAAALKSLCNLVYNSTVCATLTARSYAPSAILTRLRTYRDHKIPTDIKLFDMRLLFLITALAPEVCPKLKEEYHAVIYLTEALDLILKESDPSATKLHRVHVNDENVQLCCEILKILFNILARRSGLAEDDTEEEYVWERLTRILHDLLISEVSDIKKEELWSNAVNLLMGVPAACYKELVAPADEDLPKNLQFEGHTIESVKILQEFLTLRLAPAERSRSKQELLSPILTVLLQLSRSQRIARKYLKYCILPPLRDVMSRPEEGESLRAQLCRLLTSPSSIVKDLVADFLFTLCKSNVNRMIKYTGYGNSAGLLAHKGLMSSAWNDGSSSSYSSDSDSETEEYAKYASQINPVLGCYEPPHQNPMEGMSEEEKEYHAVNLVNMIDKLNRVGVIQPCTVGQDGKPHPISHVLELQEGKKNQSKSEADKSE